MDKKLSLSQVILQARKALKISSVALSEIAQISRVTLHRIEKGEPSVAMGSYESVLQALGLKLSTEPLRSQNKKSQTLSIPVLISLKDYPGLKSIAWQVVGVDSVTPQEAYDIYERNKRYLDQSRLSQNELDLIKALRLVFSSQEGS